MKNNDSIKLPDLPYGEGSMRVVEKGGNQYVEYQKVICGKREYATGKTVQEALKKMKEKEKAILLGEKKVKSGSITLGEAIKDWHERVKKVSLKKTSFEREMHTINNQVLPYPIAKMQMQAIDDIVIQEHINMLKDKPSSKVSKGGNTHSYKLTTLKKVYEILNQFFKYYYKNNPNKNPMLVVIKPNINTTNEKPKETDFFDSDDLELFLKEAVKCYPTGTPIYRYGPLLCFCTFALLRVGELRALRWSDIDFENGVVDVKSTVSKVIDESKPAVGGKHVYKDIHTPPKNGLERKVHLSEDALEYLRLYRERISPVNDADYICISEKGNLVESRNLRRCLNGIQRNSGMSVQNSGMHALRHTGVTFYVRNGVQETLVARMAGHKDLKMIHETYLHFADKDMVDAVNSVIIPVKAKRF